MATANRENARLALSLGGMVARSFVSQQRALARTRARSAGRRDLARAETTEFDPLDAAVLADPYPWYSQLHAGARAHYNASRRVWILHRMEDVVAGAKAHDVLSSAETIMPTRASMPMMITQDRPTHTRIRKIVAPEFTRAAIGSRVPAFEQLAATAVDDAVERRTVDGVADLGARFPIEVIADLLGVPGEDREQFREWSDRAIVAFSVTRLRDLPRSATALTTALELHSYFLRVFRERRRHPEDDLISKLVRSSDEGQLSETELFWMMVLILLAGNETTRSLISSLLLLLAQQPELTDRLRANPDLVEPTIEEGLRYFSPIQGLYRTALTPYRLGDLTIPAGERVLLLFGAANRDHRVFAEPDQFDPERANLDHVAFGSGIHFCLGAHLARVEARLMLSTILDRISRIELVGDPEWNGNPSVRGLTKLPLRLVA